MPLSPMAAAGRARRGREDGGARREHRGAVRRQGPGRAIQRRVRVGHELEGLRLEHAGVRGRDPHAQAGRRAVRELHGVVYLHAGRDNFVRDDLSRWTSRTARTPRGRSSRSPAAAPCRATATRSRLWTGSSGRTADSTSPAGSARRCTGWFAETPAASGWIRRTASGQRWNPSSPLNESRIGVISPDGTLHSLQVGSADAKVGGGAVNTPEEMYWDVYKVGDVLDLDERELRPEDLVPVNGKKLRVEHTTTSKGKEYLPRVRARLVANTRLEDDMLKYVDEFRAKFAEFYPDRRPLLLDPLNECGVRKFVCTTVRPSKLEHTSLYDPRLCCEFKEHPEHEQLSPSVVPERRPVAAHGDGVASGTASTSVALCSLLVGVGYEHRCTHKRVRAEARHDQRPNRAGVPQLEREAAQRAREEEARANAPAPEVKQSKYKVKQLIDLTHGRQTAAEEARAAKEADSASGSRRRSAKRAEAAAAADAVRGPPRVPAGEPGRARGHGWGGDAAGTPPRRRWRAGRAAGDGEEAAAADGEAGGEDLPPKLPRPSRRARARARGDRRAWPAETAAEPAPPTSVRRRPSGGPGGGGGTKDKVRGQARARLGVVARASARWTRRCSSSPDRARYPVDASPYQGLSVGTTSTTGSTRRAHVLAGPNEAARIDTWTTRVGGGLGGGKDRDSRRRGG